MHTTPMPGANIHNPVGPCYTWQDTAQVSVAKELELLLASISNLGLNKMTVVLPWPEQ